MTAGEPKLDRNVNLNWSSLLFLQLGIKGDGRRMGRVGKEIKTNGNIYVGTFLDQKSWENMMIL